MDRLILGGYRGCIAYNWSIEDAVSKRQKGLAPIK